MGYWRCSSSIISVMRGDGHGAGDDIQLLGAIDAVGLFQLGQKFLPEEAHHAHAVFQLVVVLIELRLRDGAAGLEVPLIAGVDDALAVAALALVAELFHDVDDGGAGLGVVGRLLEEVLAVIRHAAGDCRHALHHRGQLQQVGEGAAELVAVVDAPAEHQLAVDGDAALHQTGQVLRAPRPPRLFASIRTRSWGLVVWTEMLMGEMCILMMRSISWSCMLVMVI